MTARSLVMQKLKTGGGSPLAYPRFAVVAVHDAIFGACCVRD